MIESTSLIDRVFDAEASRGVWTLHVEASWDKQGRARANCSVCGADIQLTFVVDRLPPTSVQVRCGCDQTAKATAGPEPPA
jgi:hypothetical protein